MTYSGGPIGVVIEAAWGADPDGDPAGWVFTDISSDLLTPVGGTVPAVVIRKGKADAAGQSAPTNVAFALKNPHGQYSPGLATGANYPNVLRNVPIRVSLTGVGVDDPYERATVFVDSWMPRWDTSLRIAVVSVSASGRLRRLQQGNLPLRSPLYRAITGSSPPVVAYWPAEDAAGATALASAVPGIPAATTSGMTYAADSSLRGSMPVPTVNTTAGSIHAQVPAYTATNCWTAIAAVRVTATPASTTEIFSVTTLGSAARWALEIVPNGPDQVHLRAYTALGSSLLDASANLDEDTAYSKWFLVSIRAQDVSGHVEWSARLDFESGATPVTLSSTLNSQTAGNVVEVTVPNIPTGSSGSGGHLALATDVSFDEDNCATIAASLDGGAEELPAGRFAALCAAAGIPYDIVSPAGAQTSLPMGSEPVGSLINGLREAEQVDGGIIHDGGTLGDLVFVERASLYNAAVAMTIAMSAKELAPPFEPAYDDQNIRNDVTVSRSGGSSGRFIGDQSEGAYAEQVTLNLNDDVFLYEIAGWRVHLGSITGLRYPVLSIDLRRAPTLAAEWLACQIGSRITASVTMSQHPPDGPDVLLLGYTERVSSHMWQMSGNCAPFSPYAVGVLDSASLGKLDTAGCELHATWNGSSGSFTVDTTDGPLWTTDGAQYPFDLDVDGQRVTVSACSGSSNPQTFTVSVASVNGVSFSHPAGTAVKLWSPLVLAL